jgi:uncharacterized membrane protein
VVQWLIVGLALFFAVHSVSIVNRTWRNRMVAQLGEGAWKGLYSVLAAVGLVCAVYGYGLALYGVFVVWAHGMLIGVPILPGGG